VLIFYANGRSLSSGDNVGTVALAASLATTASFDLSPALSEGRLEYSIRQVGDFRRIAFPPGTGILAAPIYGLAHWVGGLSATALVTDTRVEKAAAAFLSILAVSCFLLLARERWSLASTLAATALLVAGTPLLTTLSQGLWSHTGELVALAVCLLLLRDSGSRANRGLAAGLAAGFAVWCRPTAILLLPIPLAMLAGRRARYRFAAGALLGIGALVLLNLAWFGSPTGAYGGINQDKFHPFELEAFSRLLGVLASPSRGFLWYFPALLISLIAVSRDPGDSEAKRLHFATATATVSVVLVVASYYRWWGGQSVGPRLLAELALPSALALGAALERIRGGKLRIALFAAAGVQILFTSMLHFAPNADSWNVEVAIDANPAARMSWRNSQLRAAMDRNWTYKETGAYFDDAVLERARAGFAWVPIDLRSVANTRYDLPSPTDSHQMSSAHLHLERLAQEPLPPESHLRMIPPGVPNVVRTCTGESASVAIAEVQARKVDTIILFRGTTSEREQAEPAGFLTISFANDKQSILPLRFGSHVLLRTQLNLEYEKLSSRFFAGSISAPDALQRQRFSLSGKSRVVSGLRLEMPASGPNGCLFLLAVSLGSPLESS